MRTPMVLMLLLLAPPAFAEEARARFRITGLFQPDRVDDLRRQAGTLAWREGAGMAEARLVAVDYESAMVTFGYDAGAPGFKNRKPEQVFERLNQELRSRSRGAFQLFPAGAMEPGKLREERIAVAGLDCKGCAYGAYRAIAMIDGVERAVVSFRDGHVTARIDSAKTNREALVTALRKAQVDVTQP